jgi:hypothetical protein
VFPRTHSLYITLTRNSYGPNECECGVMQSEMRELTLREYFRALLDEESPDRAEIWMELITKCSKRKLTFEFDRLPAISGLAKSLQERDFGEYLAGLWKENLPRQLLWTASGRRTPSYRAPTWSFASVEASSILDCCDKVMSRCTCKSSRPVLSPLARIREVLCATALYKSLVPCNLGLSSET